MRAAAYDVGRAEHDRLAMSGGLARGRLVDREFRDRDAERLNQRRMSGVMSSWESIGTPAARAAAASRSSEAGTSDLRA